MFSIKRSINNFEVNQSFPLIFLVLGSANEFNSQRNGIASIDRHQQFRRLDRNRGVDYKPFKFPTSSTTLSEHSRRVKFPSERHSLDSEPAAAVNPIRSIVVFPRSEMNSVNELPEFENAEMESSISIGMQPNLTFVPNTVNVSISVVNETGIDNEYEPAVYIDDDNGVFQVKYVPKVGNVSISHDEKQHSNEQSLASINKTEKTAIISNDNRQIPGDHSVPSKSNNVSSPTNDLIHGNTAINNTEMIFQWSEAHTKDTAPTPQQSSLNNNKQTKLFNGQPIFV